MSQAWYFEKFDQHKLNYILNNAHRFQPRIYDVGYNPYELPKKMLQNSKGGILRTSYHYAAGRNNGRLFANGGISLQSICREIRHSISSEFYDDIDVKNAHPVILSYLCTRHNIVCDNLNEYINNRNKHLNELIQANNIDKDTGKMIFLSLINGGAGDYKKLKKPTIFIKRFKREAADILSELCELYPDEYKIRKEKHPENAEGSTINSLMCVIENSILRVIVDFYKEKNIITDNCILCFDGVMIPKNPLTPHYIQECQERVLNEVGIAIELALKPMDQGFDTPEEIPKYIEYKPFDPTDNFTWLEFDEKYRGKLFTSQREVIDETRSDLNRVLCRVEQGKGFTIKKTDTGNNLIDIVDGKFTDLFLIYMEDEKKHELTFTKYLKIFANDINRYRSIDFAPNSTDPKIFNLWTGYVAVYTSPPGGGSNIQPILNHIKFIICNNDEVSYDYFLDWLYIVLKNPETAPGVAIFLYSKTHGAGKNILLDFLQKYVFGDNITFYTAGLTNVLEKHNHLLKSKKVVIVDEMASSSDSYVSNFDMLKSIMTGGQLTINPKGVQQYTINNVLAWILVSNHIDSILLERTDRRYFCLEVNESKVGDRKYFKELSDTFSQDTGNAFFTFIIDRGDSRDVNIRTPPLNDFKKQMIMRGWSSSIKFLNYVREAGGIRTGDYDTEGEPIVSTDVKAAYFYQCYKQWCQENTEKVKSNTKFGSDVEKHITKTRRRDGIRYDTNSINV